ncbi:Zinc transporter ZIP1 [Pseudolycoriella hygida]|uniref:Zinc transporter ZIP1 n=1 Tax=Pseudolycoriella hygida TaxID=35572 RepID=A0A9Q0MK02_9DIPT|nr:Zinc transporter ZIP1 [Pseudolycoriella hygida]
MDTLAFVYVFTFAAVSPMGIGIGIIVSGGESTTASLVSAILQGLASGTLLYVVFFEILQKGRSGILQFFAVIFGYSLMFALTFIIH